MDSVSLSNAVRVDVLEMIHNARASHIGSAYSIIDILAVLYADIMNVDPHNPYDANRDRFILSKGHAGVAVYATLAEMGFFSKNQLNRYYQNGSYFSGHVSSKGVPGVDLSTGSLGHGASVACGMALSAKISKDAYNVYCIIGDGESEEGCIYEMALFSSKYHLNNFTIIIDSNKFQAMGTCQKVIGDRDLVKQWASFGWDVIEINGHNHDEIRRALSLQCNRPKVIIANTIKGKGVSFMENDNIWHYRPPTGDNYHIAMMELVNHNEKSRD